MYSHHTPSAILSGFPLARGWISWHLRPKRSEDARFEHLSLVVLALSRTQRSIKHFECQSRHCQIRPGLSPLQFAGCDMTERFPRHMATTLWQLGSLKLQITPRSDILGHENAEALDFLPQFLEKMIGLKSLDLVLITAERVEKQRRLSLALLEDTCYTYSQVFPRRSK